LLSHHIRLAITLVALASCQDPPPLYPATAPDEIRKACAHTDRKCTACHDRERIVYARHTALEWRTTVERMRRFPGSGITPEDTEIIMQCLSYNAESSRAVPASPDLVATQDGRHCEPLQSSTR
jgi:hypothetical protein